MVIFGMPGEGAVHIPKNPRPDQKGFAAAPLLRGAAKVDNRPGKTCVLQILLHRYGRRQRPHAQQIVPAAVAAASGNKGPGLRNVRLLAQTRQGIVFPQNPDDRLSVAITAQEGRGKAPNGRFHRKTLLQQSITKQLLCEIFPERQLRVVPDGIGQTAKPCGFFFDTFGNPPSFFLRIHILLLPVLYSSFSENRSQPFCRLAGRSNAFVSAENRTVT